MISLSHNIWNKESINFWNFEENSILFDTSSWIWLFVSDSKSKKSGKFSSINNFSSGYYRTNI